MDIGTLASAVRGSGRWSRSTFCYSSGDTVAVAYYAIWSGETNGDTASYLTWRRAV